MSFGLDNLGVINQRSAPAIYISNFADFPTTGVVGRILIAKDTSTTYLDLINGASPQRAVLGQGLLGDGNGTNVTQNGGDYEVNLGGDLTGNVQIPLNGSSFTFQGTDVETTLNPDGSMSFLPLGGSGITMPVEDIGSGVVVANTRLQITDPRNGTQYVIAASS